MTPSPAAKHTIDDAVLVMLRALAWICEDEDRAARLLALTGLDADALRAGADHPDMLAAIGEFLAGHEADLVACADALGVPPARIVAASDTLAGAR